MYKYSFQYFWLEIHANDAIRQYNDELEKMNDKHRDSNAQEISASSSVIRTLFPLSSERLTKRFAPFAIVQYKMFPLSNDGIKSATNLQNMYNAEKFFRAENFFEQLENKLHIRSIKSLIFHHFWFVLPALMNSFRNPEAGCKSAIGNLYGFGASHLSKKGLFWQRQRR